MSPEVLGTNRFTLVSPSCQLSEFWCQSSLKKKVLEPWNFLWIHVSMWTCAPEYAWGQRSILCPMFICGGIHVQRTHSKLLLQVWHALSFPDLNLISSCVWYFRNYDPNLWVQALSYFAKKENLKQQLGVVLHSIFCVKKTAFCQNMCKTYKHSKWLGSLTNNFCSANFEKSFYKWHQNVSMITVTKYNLFTVTVNKWILKLQNWSCLKILDF